VVDPGVVVGHECCGGYIGYCAKGLFVGVWGVPAASVVSIDSCEFCVECLVHVEVFEDDVSYAGGEERGGVRFVWCVAGAGASVDQSGEGVPIGWVRAREGVFICDAFVFRVRGVGARGGSGGLVQVVGCAVVDVGCGGGGMVV
jgi:hypothetical protein